MTPVSARCESPNPFDRVKVFLRIRPLFTGEKSINFSIHENEITVHPPSCSGSSTFCVDKLFSFRSILDHTITQSQVFETVAAPLVEDFLHGSDVLIFCYGSTNAGKTYTVNGTKENPGILKRSLETIVQRKLPNQSIHVSFIEIYNEIIYDLLDSSKHKDSKRLGVNEEGEIEVKNAIEIEITSLAEATAAFERGEVARHRGFTEFNAESSRSHTICRIGLSDHRKHSYLSIVDLAGCERLSIMNSTAGSFKEACNINKSMLVLGKCIRQLKERSSTGKKTPLSYRESKLTHLFKSFFEPVRRPSQAAICVNVSPSHLQLEDTIFALQFAAEASQCIIRQVVVQQEEEEEEEAPEDFETRLRRTVRQDMDAVLARQQQHTDESIDRLSMRCESLCLAHLCKTRTDDSSSESELTAITKANAALEAKLAELQSTIQEKERQYASVQEDLAGPAAENAELSQLVAALRQQIQATRNDFHQIDLVQYTKFPQPPALPPVATQLLSPRPITD
jgi:hypothetical protein